jgi:hypothetical protein
MRPLRSPLTPLLAACLLAGCGSAPPEKLVPLESVPAAVLEVARTQLPDVEFKQVLQRTSDHYEVRGQDKTGKVRTINLTSTGEVLEIE